MIKKILALCAYATALAASSASVVLSDTFTYPDGPVVGPRGSPWVTHSGTAGTMVVTNNQLWVAGTSAKSEDVNAPLAGAPYLASDPTAKLYSKFTLVISNTLPSTIGAYIAHFKGTNSGAATDFGARVFLTASNTISFAPVPAGKFRIAIGNGAAATNNTYLGHLLLPPCGLMQTMAPEQS